MAFHLSVFLENKPGRLEKIMKVLSENSINLRAMSLASSGDFGVTKLLVNDPSKAFDELKKQKITVTKRKIAAVIIENVPGSFYELLKKLSEKGMNIEDCYGFLLNDGKTAVMVLEVENQPEAGTIMKDLGLNVLEDDKIYNY
jgi:ACT domain-containing protein